MDFRAIRPIRGSANNGFEELCCQLAGKEAVPAGSRFVRNGTPDGGVECYWIYSDGSEHAWQAKYFFEIESSQWTQLSDSITTALDKHPALTRYTVCLPIDLPDARVSGRESLRQKWDRRVTAWEALAAKRGMTVRFELWDAYELLSRLAEERHAGRRWFWFRQTELSPEWIEGRVAEALHAAGPRYTPELNIALPIARRFDALGYTEVFRSEVASIRGKCRKAYGYLEESFARADPGSELGTAQSRIVAAWEDLVHAIDGYGDPLPDAAVVASIPEKIRAVRGTVVQWTERLAEHLRRESEELPTRPAGARRDETIDREPYSVSQLFRAINEFEQFRSAWSVELATRPSLLLVGEAGSGKTHLFCDVASARVRSGLPSVVVLGEQLDRGEFWHQAITRLGLNCTRDEFLGAFDAAGEAAGGRAIVFVDALNEAAEMRWLSELPTMLTALERYPYVGLAVSCRSTYERTVIPEALLSERGFVRVEHDGFAPRLFEALATFCMHYGLETLNAPPLNPEFENPLFLKLFCKGLQLKGLTRPPRGHYGFRRVFSFLIDTVNEKLARPNELDFPESERLVQRAVDVIADEMVRAGRNFLPLANAKALMEALLVREGQGYSRTLLRRLLAEGILAEDQFWQDGHEQPLAVVRFGYERMADYQIAGRLLEKELATTTIEAAFGDGGALNRIFAPDRVHDRQGLLAAMIVLVPERTGREVSDLMPALRVTDAFRRAFLEALPWREGAHVSPVAMAVVEDLLARGTPASARHSEADRAWERLIQLAGMPDHPLNARWLHRRLCSLLMPDRDREWSTFLHRSHADQPWKTGTAVERLLNWAWPENAEDTDPCTGFEPEVVLLSAITLTWFFTTPNRFIRDRATKGLVCTLHNRLDLVPTLLTEFHGVNDPYVSERLQAAIFGAACRNSDIAQVRIAAEAVFQHVFAGGRPPAHVLLRDYARCTIEYAASIGCNLSFDIALARPPYASEPLADTLPTWTELDDNCRDQQYFDLTLSLSPGSGDFSRYVLGTDSHSNRGIHTWTDQPDPFAETRALAAQRPVLPASLAQDLWQAIYGRHLNLVEFIRAGEGEDDADDVDEPVSEAPGAVPIRTDPDEAEEEGHIDRFLSSLSSDDRSLVERYLEVDASYSMANEAAEQALRGGFRENDYPVRWILRRVFELGWTPDRFAEFDRAVMERDTRQADKPERIGKKYQWIAYHELSARTFDHRPFHHDLQHPEVYRGPWQLGLRDIDPSFLVQAAPSSERSQPTWWMQTESPLRGIEEMPDWDWLVHRPSIPDCAVLLSVRQPSDGSDWYPLEMYCSWRETDREFEIRNGGYRRELSFSLGALIVRERDLPAFVAALPALSWNGREVGGGDIHEQFLGECCWAPSYRDFADEADVWTRGGDFFDNTQLRHYAGVPFPVATTTCTYRHSGGGFDCSLTESVSGLMPSIWLAREMGLRWGGSRFRFVDRSGNVVVYDPSHDEGTQPLALLVRKAPLLDFLGRCGYRVVWLVVGEKRIPGAVNTARTEHRAVIQVFRQAFTLTNGTIETLLRSTNPLGEDPVTY